MSLIKILNFAYINRRDLADAVIPDDTLILVREDDDQTYFKNNSVVVACGDKLSANQLVKILSKYTRYQNIIGKNEISTEQIGDKLIIRINLENYCTKEEVDTLLSDVLNEYQVKNVDNDTISVDSSGVIRLSNKTIEQINSVPSTNSSASLFIVSTSVLSQSTPSSKVTIPVKLDKRIYSTISLNYQPSEIFQLSPMSSYQCVLNFENLDLTTYNLKVEWLVKIAQDSVTELISDGFCKFSAESDLPKSQFIVVDLPTNFLTEVKNITDQSVFTMSLKLSKNNDSAHSINLISSSLLPSYISRNGKEISGSQVFSLYDINNSGTPQLVQQNLINLDLRSRSTNSGYSFIDASLAEIYDIGDVYFTDPGKYFWSKNQLLTGVAFPDKDSSQPIQLNSGDCLIFVSRVTDSKDDSISVQQTIYSSLGVFSRSFKL